MALSEYIITARAIPPGTAGAEANLSEIQCNTPSAPDEMLSVPAELLLT